MHRGKDNPAYKHGMRHSAEYEAWAGIKQRIFNPKNKVYAYYGGRGIDMEPRWVNDFMAFFLDVGARPSSKHSIDRIDNSKGYYANNIHWATRTIQSRNRRNNILIEHCGKTLCLKEWCLVLAQPYKRVWRRMNSGWSFDDAIKPIDRNK